MCKDSVIALYERHAEAYDRDRSQSLQERPWLDRFLDCIPAGGTVLDIGCGMAEPIARYVLERGFHVHGVDAAPSMIRLCQARFPESEWTVADMRGLALGRRFDGLVAWDSFFHLSRDDQRAMFGTFAAHARPGAPLLFTSGPTAGETIGSYRGQPLYHASLDATEYAALLNAHGFRVEAHTVEDPSCGGHTVWLATFAPSSSGGS